CSFLPASATIAAGRGGSRRFVKGVRQPMGLLNFKRIGPCAYLIVAAFVLVSAAPARAQTTVKFSLDGRLEGPEALILVPQDQGFFRNEGLEVSVDDAATPLEPITRVATGGYAKDASRPHTPVRYR